MAAYYTALILSLAGALWLIPGARLHVLGLAAWLAVSVLLDIARAYELKLFADFFGFLFLTWATILNITKGRYTVGQKVCAYLAGCQVAFSAIAYGVSYGFAGLYLPYSAFSGLLSTYGVVLNSLFIASVWALFAGGNVRDRAFDTVRSLGRLRLRRARIFATPEAYGSTPSDCQYRP